MPLQGLDLLLLKGDLEMNNPEGYRGAWMTFGGSFMRAFLPQTSGLYRFSTCLNYTNVDATLDVWSGETLEHLASASNDGFDCLELEALPMTAGKPYFAFFQTRRNPDPVRRVLDVLQLSVTLEEETGG